MRKHNKLQRLQDPKESKNRSMMMKSTTSVSPNKIFHSVSSVMLKNETEELHEPPNIRHIILEKIPEKPQT